VDDATDISDLVGESTGLDRSVLRKVQEYDLRRVDRNE
jgi:hypothetical protein